MEEIVLRIAVYSTIALIGFIGLLGILLVGL